MKKKHLVALLTSVFCACGTVGVLAACGEKVEEPTNEVHQEGDTIVEEKDVTYTVDNYGNVQKEYTGKEINVKYVLDDSSYIVLSGDSQKNLALSGFGGAITSVSLKDIEEKVKVNDDTIVVTSVAAGAFNGCTTLQTVDLTSENQVLTFDIGDYAFNGCTSLTSVTLPTKVYSDTNSIGSYAFANCESLSTVTIGDKYQSIGSSAFSGDVALKSITLPSKLTTISSSTFQYCENLATVSYPSTLRSIGSYAFANTGFNTIDLSSLTKLTYVGDSAYLATPATKVSLPNSVSYIGYKAFYDSEKLATVNVPFIGNNINSINETSTSSFSPTATSAGQQLLKNIYGLSADEDERELEFTVNYTSAIPVGLFSNYENLKSITIKNFAEGTFNVYNSDGITISKAIKVSATKTIGEGAFYNCTGLTTTSFPQGIEEIGTGAFYGCEKLAAIDVQATTETIGYGAYYGCKAAETVTLNAGIKEIGDYAFYGCEAFTTLTIPSTVTSIGSSAFYKCDGLTSLTIEKLDGLLDVEYDELGNIETNGVTESDLYNDQYYYTLPAVSDWYSHTTTTTASSTTTSSTTTAKPTYLTSITVKEAYIIGASKFAGLDSVKTISVTFVDKLNNKAFDEDEDNTSTVNSNAFANDKALTAVTLNEGNVTYIGASAFANDYKLSSVTLPSTVTQIATAAFSNCVSLGSITLPADLTTIASNAFRNCARLYYITIPENVTSVGSGAFNGCANLGTITIQKYDQVVADEKLTEDALDTSTYKSLGSIRAWFGTSFYTTDLPDDEYLISNNYFTSNGAYYIPDALSTVKINSVCQLDSYALYGLDLSNVSLNFVESLTAKKLSTSRNAEKLVSKTYYAQIGSYAVSNVGDYYTSISITGGEYVKKIDSNAFDETYITDANLAAFSNVTYIGSKAFANNYRLTTVTLPASLIEVGSNIFYNCRSIATLNIGRYDNVSGVQEVSNLFGATSSSNGTTSAYNFIGGIPKTLTTVTVSNLTSPTALNVNAFKDMSTLKQIALYTTADETSLDLTYSNNPFSGCTSLIKVYVPSKITKVYYSGTSYWDFDIGSSTANATVYLYTSNSEPTSYGTGHWYTKESGVKKELTFKANKYTLVANVDGVEDTVVEKSAGSVLLASDLPTNLTKEGYVLKGWAKINPSSDTAAASTTVVTFPYYTNNGTVADDAEEGTEPTGTKLYAVWVAEDDYEAPEATISKGTPTEPKNPNIAVSTVATPSFEALGSVKGAELTSSDVVTKWNEVFASTDTNITSFTGTVTIGTKNYNITYKVDADNERILLYFVGDMDEENAPDYTWLNEGYVIYNTSTNKVVEVDYKYNGKWYVDDGSWYMTVGNNTSTTNVTTVNEWKSIIDTIKNNLIPDKTQLSATGKTFAIDETTGTAYLISEYSNTNDTNIYTVVYGITKVGAADGVTKYYYTYQYYKNGELNKQIVLSSINNTADITLPDTYSTISRLYNTYVADVKEAEREQANQDSTSSDDTSSTDTTTDTTTAGN